MLTWVLLGAAVVALAFLAAPRRSEGPPLDPTSTDALGTRALVVLLEEMGSRVDIAGSVPGPEHDTALVLVDDLTEQQADALRAWVRTGGVAVVADPGSELIPVAPERSAAPGVFDVEEDDALPRRCELAALRDVEFVDPSNGVLFEPPPNGVGCFTRRGANFLVAVPFGDGTIVGIGGAATFVNGVIGKQDNAALATSLLAPTRGSRVAFLRPPPPGGGRRTLWELVSDRVKGSLWQLGVAFGVLVLWRARRLGRPVLEPHPVELAGSELVVAIGNLLQVAKRRDHAATLLRKDLRSHLARRLGLPPDAPAEIIAEVAAGRTGVDRARLASALADRPVGDDTGLVALGQTVEAVREEVTHAP